MLMYYYGLAIMAVHRGIIKITADEVLDELEKKKKKKLN